MRLSTAIVLGTFLSQLAGCATFPELEVSEAQFDSKTPYPKPVPLDELLTEPEPSITDEVQEELTTRRDDLLETPDAEDAEEAKDPVLDRIDALRKKREEQAQSDPVIDDELRKRMEGGITPPTVPE